MTFAKELEDLINRHSLEQESDTPDFILAHFLLSCLQAWNTSTVQREVWYGRDRRPISMVPVTQPPCVSPLPPSPQEEP